MLNNRRQCECDLNLKEGETCQRAKRWMRLQFRPDEHPYLRQKYSELKERVNSLREEQNAKEYHDNKFDYFQQIEKDLLRTYPCQEFYREGGQGIEMLRQVLCCFCIFDP